MTYYLIVGGQEQMPLATTSGWADLKLWSRILTPAAYPQLVHLIDHGWAQQLDSLALEIKKAMLAHAPDTESVAATLEDLYYAVAYSGEAASVFVSDGMGEKFAAED